MCPLLWVPKILRVHSYGYSIVMTAAFKEYTGVSLKKEQRQSIRKKLEQAKERVAKHREITKEKMKDRGQVR